MALLNSPWRLLDIDDVEALVVSAIGRSRHAGTLAPHERDDLVQDALVAVWRASTRHDPARGKFATVAYVVVQREVVNRLRREHRTIWRLGDGRVYERERPELVSYEREFVSHAGAGVYGGPRAPTTNALHVDWDALSPNSRWTLQHLSIPLSHGYSPRELAKRH